MTGMGLRCSPASTGQVTQPFGEADVLRYRSVDARHEDARRAPAHETRVRVAVRPRPAAGAAGAPALVSWMWIVVMARDMYGPMTGASAWMMTGTWDVPHLLLLWAMWAVM